VVAFAVAVAAWLGTAELAFAASGVSLNPAPDGTIKLVGSGWRPGQQLVISLGTDEFPALADAAGSFEIPTGILARGGLPLSMTIRRPETNALAFATAAPPAALDVPNPFALLFAESLAMGTRWFALSAVGLGVAALAARTLRARASR
jgi:hypothetical protein